MTKKITAKEYAALVGVTGKTVTIRLQKNNLPGIIKSEKLGNYWQLTIPANFDGQKIKEKYF